MDLAKHHQNSPGYRLRTGIFESWVMAWVRSPQLIANEKWIKNFGSAIIQSLYRDGSGGKVELRESGKYFYVAFALPFN